MESNEKMKCIACGKESEPNNELCPMCEAGWLAHEAEVALGRYIEVVNKLLHLEKEKQNESECK